MTRCGPCLNIANCYSSDNQYKECFQTNQNTPLFSLKNRTEVKSANRTDILPCGFFLFLWPCLFLRLFLLTAIFSHRANRQLHKRINHLPQHKSHKKTSQQEIFLPRCTTYILPKTDSGQSEMITHLPEQHLFLPFSIAFPFHKPSPDTLLKDSVLPFPFSNHRAEV